MSGYKLEVSVVSIEGQILRSKGTSCQAYVWIEGEEKKRFTSELKEVKFLKGGNMECHFNSDFLEITQFLHDNGLLKIQIYEKRKFALNSSLVAEKDIRLKELKLDKDKVDHPQTIKDLKLNEGGKIFKITMKFQLKHSDMGRSLKSKQGRSDGHRLAKQWLDEETKKTFSSYEPDRKRDQAPNELHVFMLRAVDLLEDQSGNNMYFAEVEVGGQSQVLEHKLLTIKQQQIYEHLVFQNCTKRSDFLRISFYMPHSLRGDEFCGLRVESLRPYEHGKLAELGWCSLKNQRGRKDETRRGKVELALQWVHNPLLKTEASEKKKWTLSNMFKKKDPEKNEDSGEKSHSESKDGADSEDMEALEEGEESDVDEVDEEASDVEMNAKGGASDDDEDEGDAAGKKVKKEEPYEEVEPKAGDYSCIIHIIEVRDLHAENLDGTSDPVINVEAFNQKFCTEIKEKCLSAVFDEKFVIQAPNLQEDDLEESVISISCYDSEVLPVNKPLIGKFSVDTKYVYSQKDHEIYRQWVALVDDENPEDVGVQGYLQLSIMLAGPGEQIKEHDEAKDIAEEKKKGNKMQCLQPPTIKLSTKWLRTRIFYADYLPEMDVGVTASAKNGIDAFVQVKLGASKPMYTKIQEVQGVRKELAPQWNEEIWIPTQVPSFGNSVNYKVYDKDGFTKILVARFHSDFKRICKMTDNHKVQVHWVNLYGSHILPWRNHIIKSISQRQAKNEYNQYPEKAPSFRGRILIEERAFDEDKFPYGDKKVAFRRVFNQKREMQPSVKYHFSAVVLTGSNLPDLKDKSNLNQKFSYHIRITCGAATMFTTKKEPLNGNIKWVEFLDDDVTFPEKVEDIPDVFVYLCIGSIDKYYPVCFKRFPAKELLSEKNEWKPFRIDMEPDRDVGYVGENTYPGTLWIQLTLKVQDQTDDEDQGVEEKWYNQYMQHTFQKKKDMHVHVHVFQARGLPETDDDGACDPYLKIKVPGAREEGRTVTKFDTLYPSYYETHCFHTTLDTKPNSNLIEHDTAPMIRVELYDSNAFGDSKIGVAMVPLAHALPIEAIFDHRNKAPTARPYPINVLRAAVAERKAEVLISVQYGPLQPNEVRECPNPPPIEPKMEKKWLELLVLGCRNMKKFQGRELQFPRVEFLMPSAKQGEPDQVFVSENSKRPSGRDPNMLQRLVSEVYVPKNPLYAAPLTVKVVDFRLGGFYKPIVGVGEITLSSKLPQGLYHHEEVEDDKKDSGAPEEKNNGPDDGASKDEEVKDEQEVPGVSQDGVLEEKENDLDRGASQGDEEVNNLPKHLADDGIGVSKKLKQTTSKLKPFHDQEENEGESDEEPEYMKDRRSQSTPLEELIGNGPFESVDLWLGSKLKGNHRKVGVFKGIVRIMKSKDEPSIIPDVKKFLKPQHVVARLYVLRATALTPMDFSISGQGKSDPYLVCNLGKKSVDNRDQYIANTIDADFYQVFEFTTDLPGPSLLEVTVKDRDDFGARLDDDIGSTVIDLEDRWFDSTWHEIGQSHQWPQPQVETANKDINQPDDQKKKRTNRFAPKDLESRPLMKPTSKASQGNLCCWLDLLDTQEAGQFPTVDIALPPHAIFEVRVVVWKTKDIPAGDALEDMSDMYARVWLEGTRPQETDVHWRAKGGKGSFNWRMIFNVELGHNTRAMKFPYFHIQMWDKDILKWNDCLCDSMFDVGKAYKKAYRRNKAVQVFKDKEKIKSVDASQGGDPDSETTGLVSGNTKKKPSKGQKQKKSENAFVTELRQKLGLAPVPPDSEWIELEKTNKDGTKEKGGKVCISVQVMPKAAAESQPVGHGRSEPNQDPFCPKPTGRMKLTLNPFSMLYQILGPKLCCKLACLICCVLGFFICLYLGPTVLSQYIGSVHF